jgi:protein-disulfide isomerase
LKYLDLGLPALLALATVASVFIALFAFWLAPPPGGKASADESVKAVVMVSEGEMTLGADDAPVTIIEYASMSCHHCAQFHRTTFPDLKKHYIDTGKVRFIFREFPINKPALEGAMVARCAGPDRFFAFLKLLFSKQAKWATINDTGKLVSVAKLGGMTEDTVKQCLENESVKKLVLDMRMTGEREYKVTSTPTLVVNGEAHSGALSFEELEKILKPLLPAT